MATLYNIYLTDLKNLLAKQNTYLRKITLVKFNLILERKGEKENREIEKHISSRYLILKESLGTTPFPNSLNLPIIYMYLPISPNNHVRKLDTANRTKGIFILVGE